MNVTSIEKAFKGTYMLAQFDQMNKEKGYGRNLQEADYTTNFKKIYNNTERMMKENEDKKLFFEEWK